jgi:hypothetical protein
LIIIERTYTIAELETEATVPQLKLSCKKGEKVQRRGRGRERIRESVKKRMNKGE